MQVRGSLSRRGRGRRARTVLGDPESACWAGEKEESRGRGGQGSVRTLQAALCLECVGGTSLTPAQVLEVFIFTQNSHGRSLDGLLGQNLGHSGARTSRVDSSSTAWHPVALLGQPPALRTL